ncbi:hypothetical protein TD95_000364 [Thielaviopsis punctulata]|uniref:Uncharacterized protein n=1 Tax=Thielaviopsis punctulata TaxID=72032 RepID=A0A0F4ZA30_9PEZI|nr:hypothetical protein TD95_000364 [Thielaviopsis punctulata]
MSVHAAFVTAASAPSGQAMALNSTLGGSPPSGPDTARPGAPEEADWSSIIGIATAIGGNVLIALALNLQRFAHIKLHKKRAQIKARLQQAQRIAKLQALRNHATESHELLRSTDVCASSARPSTDSEYDAERDGDATNSTGFSGYGTLSGDQNATAPSIYMPPPHNASPRVSTESSRSAYQDPAYVLSEKPPSLSYLRSPYWWLGQVLITLGEMGNFLAYGFAPASIVSPLGVVALVSNCVIAPILFHEKFRARDFWGVVIAVAGVVVVVLSSAGDEVKLDPHDVWDAITALAFEVYLCVTVAMIATLMWASKRYGKRTILIDLGLVGLFGGYTALATKGVSSMLSSTLLGAFQTPVTYALLFVLIATAVMQIRYLNRALQRFDSTQVIPIQFVMFTLCVIVGSAILYRDFERTTLVQSLTFISGCLLTFFGVFLITSGRPRHHDEENHLLEGDGADETIGLALHHEAYSDVTPPDTPRSSISSRRSSRTNFPPHSDRRISVAHETGVPSSRVPTIARPSMGSRRPSTFSILDQDSGPARHDSTSLQNNPVYGADARLVSAAPEPFIEPSTPPGAAPSAFPAYSHTQTTTDASLLTTPPRPPSRRFVGPVISASPFSSAVSAVMTDTLRRPNRLTRQTSLGRLQSTIRASMFIAEYADDSPTDVPVDAMFFPPASREQPLLGPLLETVESSAAGSSTERPATSCAARAGGVAVGKRRNRSLSDTLSGLFAPNKRRFLPPAFVSEQTGENMEGQSDS